jgi:hypothetical protein
VTQQQRKRVYVSLYQSHAPKLDELGVIDLRTDSIIVATEETWRVREIMSDLRDQVCPDGGED